jgi:hypothetical protein
MLTIFHVTMIGVNGMITILATLAIFHQKIGEFLENQCFINVFSVKLENVI